MYLKCINLYRISMQPSDFQPEDAYWCVFLVYSGVYLQVFRWTLIDFQWMLTWNSRQTFLQVIWFVFDLYRYILICIGRHELSAAGTVCEACSQRDVTRIVVCWIYPGCAGQVVVVGGLALRGGHGGRAARRTRTPFKGWTGGRLEVLIFYSELNTDVPMHSNSVHQCIKGGGSLQLYYHDCLGTASQVTPQGRHR